MQDWCQETPAAIPGGARIDDDAWEQSAPRRRQGQPQEGQGRHAVRVVAKHVCPGRVQWCRTFDLAAEILAQVVEQEGQLLQCLCA
jgi:hypothetical protein